MAVDQTLDPMPSGHGLRSQNELPRGLSVQGHGHTWQVTFHGVLIFPPDQEDDEGERRPASRPFDSLDQGGRAHGGHALWTHNVHD